MTTPLKRTPLHSAHQRLGARLVEFGGWEMPVQYTGIMEEHLAVRQAAGLFDISHMGEVTLSGPAALRFVNSILTNDARKLAVGQGQYTLLPNHQGGVLDDLYLYRTAPEEFLLLVNASRIAADVSWIRQRLDSHPDRAGVVMQDLSDHLGALAIQGPAVAGFIDRAFAGPAQAGTPAPAPTSLKKNQIASFPFAASPVWVARTGYTGEDGFEIIAPAALTESIWTILLEDGAAQHGLIPCGLGARDTLRTEMGYPLYGHELDETTSPLEAGLGAFVAMDKGPFVGREALAQQKTQGFSRRCVAFRMTERSAPPRPHYPVWSADPEPSRVGQVASGTQSPSLGVGIGMGYVPIALASPGTPLAIEIRGRRCAAVVCAKPIYKKTT